ncbi:MAG: hypothetical protein PHQ75_10245, partial [Thermoguttaceae bacterium]|nr:hypothetical protein [Thermoguttaceae bacterium]
IISLWCFQGYFGQKGDEFQPVAVVEETIDAKWEPGQPILKRGQATGPNRVALRSGLVKLRYAHGAEIVLEGPGEYVLTSETALWCDRGQISATIPPGAIGYEVSTPYARFIDRGTEFAIAVSESFSRLDVVRGKVDVSWAPELPRSGFTTGMAVQVDKASQIKQVSGEPGRYVDRVRFEKRLDDFVLRETQELNRREERLRGDPNLAARFVLSDPATGTIPNTGQQTDISDAVLHDVKKGQGPLRGMNATLIGKRASAIDVNLVGKRTLFSLAVRMRIDRLENTGNVICASDNFYTAAGSIFWQILRDGRIQLQIRGKDGRVVEFLSEPVYLRPSWGTWCDLILVVDTKGKQVQFVFDDQIVLNRSWEEAVPIEIGRATIGNVEKKTRMVRNRYLGGAIAELALFDEKIKTFQ